jgi:hypothetical protein
MRVVVVFYLSCLVIWVEHKCGRLKGLFNLNPCLRFSPTFDYAR